MHRKIKPIKNEVVAEFKDKLVEEEIVNEDSVGNVDSMISLLEYKFIDCRTLYFIIGYCQAQSRSFAPILIKRLYMKYQLTLDPNQNSV